MQRRQKTFVFASAAFVVLLVALYWPFLSREKTFFLKDLTQFFQPLCTFIGNALVQGRLPLWNPYNYCGMSQAAISSPSIFYPLNWLFAVMPFSQALALIMVVSQLVCAVSVLALVLLLGWGGFAAIIAAAAVSLSGYMFSLNTNYTLVASAAWLPAAIVTAVLWLRSHKPAWLVVNALSVFMMLAAGRPEIAGPSLILLTVVAVLKWKNETGPKKTDLLALFVAMLVAILMCMPIILPSLEWLPLSRRAQGLQPGEILLFSANWYDLLSMFVPHPLGRLQIRELPVGPLVKLNTLTPYLDSAFVGSIILALAGLGVTSGGGKLYWSTLALLVVSLLLSCAQSLPFADAAIEHLPLAGFLRFPSKLLFFAVFAIALLAGRGICRFACVRPRLIPHLIVWLIFSGLALGLFLAHARILPFYTVYNMDRALSAQSMIGWRTFIAALLATASLGVLWLGQRFNKPRYALSVVTVLVLALLCANAWSFLEIAAPPDFFKQDSFIAAGLREAAKHDPVVRVTPLYSEHFTVPPLLSRGRALERTIKDFQYNRQMLQPFTNIEFGVPSGSGFEGAMVGEYFNAFFHDYLISSQALTRETWRPPSDLPLYRLLQATSTTHVITQVFRGKSEGGHADIPYLDSNYYDLVFEQPPMNVRVYRLKNPIPRAYLTAHWRYCPTRDNVRFRMGMPESSQFDPQLETLVETDIGPAQTSAEPLVPVAVSQRTPERLQISVDAPAARLLVLNDQDYPGWHADIDGKDAPIVRCNGFMRGVLIPEGKHVVSFVYGPASVFVGFLCAAFGLICCMLLLLWNRLPWSKTLALGS